MSEYWYNEDYEYEPEPEIELPDEAAELKIKLGINAGQIELAIQKQIDEVLESKIKLMINKKISAAMNSLIGEKYWAKENIAKILYEAVNNRLESKYPEVVEDKVNEFYEALMKVKYADGRHDSALANLRSKANKKVEFYIENELADSVSKSKDYIEQFAKNYFANNLFRSMGMMDKMLPQTDNSGKQ